jgi:predicted Zn finger-like uncharacterized protein
MHTRCPECDAYFQVTATQLSAGHGEVFCDLCDAEFDALPFLIDAVPDTYSVDSDRGEVPDTYPVDNDRDAEIAEPVEEPTEAKQAVAGGLPPWLGGEPGAEVAGPTDRPTREWIIATTALSIMLIAQLLHHNRDALAASPGFGDMVQSVYGSLGSTLYPEWPLTSFEIRGTEAVGGGGQSPELNILAKILIVGRDTVGMPLVRVVLRDRWSDPVASGVFLPAEYLQSDKIPTRDLQPGTTLPIQIKVADPGAEARGYVVDVCLPRRRSGLQCQLAKDPFAP